MKRNNIISDWLNEYGDPEVDKFVENQLNQNNMKNTHNGSITLSIF